MAREQDVRSALDAALLHKVQAFSIAAQRKGVTATIHARPRILDWTRDTKSFAFKAVAAISIAAAAWGAVMLNHSANQKSESPQASQIIQTVINNAAKGAVIAQEEQEAPIVHAGWKASKFEQIRRDLNYVDVKIGKQKIQVLDGASRISLAKAVADELKLSEVGVTWKELYGLIHAETGWVSRTGMGNNKVASTGLAQFEPDTAKSIGLEDPEDPVQAVYGAGVLLGHAAEWSSSKVNKKGLHLKKADLHKAFVEGLSIYYNTSTSLRKTWNVKNTENFPAATKNHIHNLSDGTIVAERLEGELKTRAAYLSSQAIKAVDKQPASEIESIQLAATTIQSSLDGDCSLREVRLAPSSKVMHSACGNAQWLEDMAKQNITLYGDVYATGTTRGIPVLMSTGSSVIFGAGVTAKPVSGELVVIVQKGLIEQISKDFSDPNERQLALSFVVGHEIGHIEDAHRDGHFSGGEMQGEMSADYNSISNLVSHGVSRNTAGDISRRALGSFITFLAKSGAGSDAIKEVSDNIDSRMEKIAGDWPARQMHYGHH